MANPGPSALFMKADFEGYLDKLSTGIASKLLTGKTRVWCELHGTTLSICKENKRTSSSNQELDMKLVHMVRKAANDKTGTQFEILSNNKSHTFCALSVGDCNNWIRHLLHAMTLKSQEKRKPSASSLSDVSVRDYETIRVLPEGNHKLMQITVKENATGSEYAEIDFVGNSVPPQTHMTDMSSAIGHGWSTTQQHSCECEEGGYASVEERKQSDSFQENTKDILVATSPEYPSSQLCEAEEEVEYAKVNKRSKQNAEQSKLVLPGSTEPRREAESRGENTNIYATAIQCPQQSGHSDEDHRHTAAGDSVSDAPDDNIETYVDALSHSDSAPIPKFPYPLMQVDVEPLLRLKKLLSKTKLICQHQLSETQVSKDPIGDMKRLLHELKL